MTENSKDMGWNRASYYGKANGRYPHYAKHNYYQGADYDLRNPGYYPADLRYGSPSRAQRELTNNVKGNSPSRETY